MGKVEEREMSFRSPFVMDIPASLRIETDFSDNLPDF
jgi:hypothetical protein